MSDLKKELKYKMKRKIDATAEMNSLMIAMATEIQNLPSLTEEDKLFCSICFSIWTTRIALNVIIINMKKALLKEKERRKLKSCLVFLIGSLTKTVVDEYFKSNFGPVANIKLIEPNCIEICVRRY